MEGYGREKSKGKKDGAESRTLVRWVSRLFARAAENGVFWMVIFLGTLSVLSLFSAGRQAIQTGGGKVRNLAEGRSHRTPIGLLPICSVDNSLDQVALTFEMTGGTEGVEEILEVLAGENVQASFFASGDWVGRHPELAKEILAQGHDLGSLGASGRSMKDLGREERQESILTAHSMIARWTGQETGLFRPPLGDYDDGLITLACGLGYQPVLWDVDSLDWKDYGAEQLKTQVLGDSALGTGSILRFHCGAKYTPEALEGIVRELKERGAVLTPLSGMLAREDYHLDEEGRQRAD